MISDIVDLVGSKLVNAVSGENGITLLILFSTAFISALIAYWRTVEDKSFGDFFSFALPKEVIMHPSARADLLFYITKRLIMPLLLIPTGIAFVALVAFGTNQLFSWIFQVHGPLLEGPTPWWVLVLFTGSMLIAYDISYYLYHVAQHKIPFLWELHKVHHSANVLTPLTVFRIHPLDAVIFSNILGVCLGLANGVATYAFGKTSTAFTIDDTNVILVIFIHVYVHLQHTHLWIPFTGIWGRIFQSPAHHQIHHSSNPAHFDRNFGSCLALWDWVFGTLRIPNKEPEKLNFGVVQGEADMHSLSELTIAPVKRAAGHLAGPLRGEERPLAGTPRV